MSILSRPYPAKPRWRRQTASTMASIPVPVFASRLAHTSVKFQESYETPIGTRKVFASGYSNSVSLAIEFSLAKT